MRDMHRTSSTSEPEEQKREKKPIDFVNGESDEESDDDRD